MNRYTEWLGSTCSISKQTRFWLQKQVQRQMWLPNVIVKCDDANDDGDGDNSDDDGEGDDDSYEADN